METVSDKTAFHPAINALDGELPRLGVLHVDSQFPLLQGHILNSRSIEHPVRYECVAGITPGQVVSQAPEVEQPLLKAAQRLEQSGVFAIVGACGSFGLYQQALSKSVAIPVFSSVIAALPLLLTTLPEHAEVAVVLSSEQAWSPRLLQQLHIPDSNRIVCMQVSDCPAFGPILENKRELNSEALEQQLCEKLDALLQERPQIAALLLQCSELAVYSETLKKHYRLPVIDITSVAAALFGFLPRAEL